MKIVFMGTPDFSVGIIKALHESKHEVVLAVTQPDRPKGRSGKLMPCPVKEYATDAGIEVFQCEKIKAAEAVEKLRGYHADLFVVAAFGQILSKEILEMPRFGCINVHASLLPKYRGASPIQQAILDGEKSTGVTIMQMNEGLDTGDILISREVAIDEKETGGSLFEKLAKTGSSLVTVAVDGIEKGELTPRKQDDSMASYAGIIKKEKGRIDFSKNAAEIERLIRAFDPWPSAQTSFSGKTLKLWRADVKEENDGSVPGTVTDITKDSFTVSCGSGQLVVRELQLEGKKRMSTKDFLLGNDLNKGDRLGE
ncbi:MAG: methionyl-tRNA formyltransferase [Lachnospiraceae bacterium]|nr:methionyl-tRNA formyltransferase [Lachnospiraceae bacterium]